MRITNLRHVAWAISLSAASLLGCEREMVPPPSAPSGVSLSSLTVTSKSFAATNNVIPVDYSCDGSSRSPQLTWSAPPEGTKSIAVVLEDPDAPNGPFIHWVLYDIKGETGSLPEGVDANAIGARAGINDNQSDAYFGPCPPKQEIHRYVFHVFALNAPTNLPAGKDRNALYVAMNGHVLADGLLVATFSH